MAMYQIGDRSLATILAALRYWQENVPTQHRASFAHFQEELHAPLGDDEIDVLCEALNCGNGEEPPDQDGADAPARARDRLLNERNVLQNSFGEGSFHDGKVRDRIAEIDRLLAKEG